MLLFCFRTRKPRTCFDTLIFPIAVTVTTKKCNISIRKLHRINFQAVGTFLRFPLLLLLTTRQWLIFALIANICFKFVFVLICCCCLAWIGSLQFSKLLNYLMFILFPRQQIQPQESPYHAARALQYHMFNFRREKMLRFFSVFLFCRVFFSLSKDSFLMLLHPFIWMKIEPYYAPCTRTYTITEISSYSMKRTKGKGKKKQYSKPNISIFRQSLNKINPRVRSLMACFYLQPLAVRIWYEWNALHRWCFVQIKLKLKYLLGKRNELKFGKIKSSFGNKHRHFLK